MTGDYVSRNAVGIDISVEESTTSQIFQMIFMLDLLVVVAAVRGVI